MRTLLVASRSKINELYLVIMYSGLRQKAEILLNLFKVNCNFRFVSSASQKGIINRTAYIIANMHNTFTRTSDKK